jgi:hypothetical protein
MHAIPTPQYYRDEIGSYICRDPATGREYASAYSYEDAHHMFLAAQ